MDKLFRNLPDVFAIIYERGVYKQVSIAVRNGELYAQAKGGFIRLSSNGATSASCKYVEIIGLPERSWYPDDLGRLRLSSPAKQIEGKINGNHRGNLEPRI